MNSKPRKKAAKRRSKKGRSRGGLKLLLSVFLIACILLVGAFYLLDVRVKVKSDNALIAKIERYFGDKSEPEQKQNLSHKRLRKSYHKRRASCIGHALESKFDRYKGAF